MTIAVMTNNLVKKFGEHIAVNGINLSVPEGAIYGFLGPNGAGKTTTLKMLTGMSEPTSGTIQVFGEDVEVGALLKRSDIGFLPDVPGFYDWMTPKEFLMFCGELYHIPPKELEDNVGELLTLVGLHKARNRRIGGFSRGMKQRLGIAQALINKPRIVFLDEPVSALDPIGRKEVMDIIATLRGKVTVFFSTHILADVERVCDHVVIIHQGKVLLEDTIDSIKSKASNQIELEFDQEEIDMVKTWVINTPWYLSCEQNHKKIVLTVSDLTIARNELLAYFVKEQIVFRKMLVVEPTLEDVFVKVVHANDQ